MSKQAAKKPRHPTRHFFFLNPYEDAAFTTCPKCEGKTKLRKLPLVIHIDPNQLFVLNKACRFCPYCDLVIGRKREIESLMTATFETRRPEIVGQKYVVVGTLDRKDWRLVTKGILDQGAVASRVFIFKDHLIFEPARWVREIPSADEAGEENAKG